MTDMYSTIIILLRISFLELKSPGRNTSSITPASRHIHSLPLEKQQRTELCIYDASVKASKFQVYNNTRSKQWHINSRFTVVKTVNLLLMCHHCTVAWKKHRVHELCVIRHYQNAARETFNGHRTLQQKVYRWKSIVGVHISYPILLPETLYADASLVIFLSIHNLFFLLDLHATWLWYVIQLSIYIYKTIL